MKLFNLFNAITMSLILIFSSHSLLAAPPGLSKGTHYPRGLKHRTPAGWTKGEKKGWYKTHTKTIKVHRRVPLNNKVRVNVVR